MSYSVPSPESESESSKPVDPEAVVDEKDLDPEVPAHHNDDEPDETPLEAQP